MVATGIVGQNEGFTWTNNEPAFGDIDADNDGVMNPEPQFVIDLSQLAGSKLGYQASMMAAYKIHRIQVGIRPVDDGVDNSEQTLFGGELFAYPATDHAKKALGLARKVEKAKEASEVDADSLFLTTENDYAGFRYGWSNVNSGGVEFTTANGVTGMAGDWYLSEIFAAYDLATEPKQANALFGGRAPEQVHVPWVCGWDMGHAGALSAALDFQSHHSLEVLPLLLGSVNYSSGDEPGAVDDDYYLQVTVEFTPEFGGVF